jgi:hypothetical protein
MPVRKRYLAAIAGAVLPAAGLAAFQIGTSNHALAAFNPFKAPGIQARLISQFSDQALGFHAVGMRNAATFNNLTPTTPGGPQCGLSFGSNIKVNQQCLNITAPDLQGRGQAQNETTIAVDPNNPNRVVAASNDYVLGDGLSSGTHYSVNGGQTWQDSQAPVQFTRASDFPGDNQGSRMYWQGGGDPSVAWDSRGNAYLTVLHFNRGQPPIGPSDIPDYSSGVYVYRSIQNGGASWTFPGTPVATSFQPTTPASGLPLLDKPYMTIDNHTSSTYRDRIYVTYTNFATDGTAYIYEAYSSDYGRSFSAPVLVSHNSTLCPQNYSSFGVAPENHNNCDENQFSDPFTGSDGTLYVVFANYNTSGATSTAPGSDNRFQILLEKSTDGGASFGAPILVGYFYDLPDCATYQGGQNELRQCVPEHGSQQNSVFRATNYPSGAVDPTNSNHVAVTYGSFINQDSKSPGCTPNGIDPDVFVPLYNGVKAGCNNKILVSESTNKGGSWTAGSADPRTVNMVTNSASQNGKDQWWQWSAFSNAGKIVATYYDRQYGSDNTNGNMDFSMSEGSGTAYTITRVTTASMPLPTEFPDSQGNSVFMGDYTGLAVSTTAHPLWTDTRDQDLFDCGTNPPQVCLAIESGNGIVANDQDIFTANLGV